MMISFIIMVMLLLAFYVGYRRGFLREIVYLAGYAFVFYLATQWYQPLGEKLSLWIPYPTPELNTQLGFYSQKLLLTLSQSFYAAMAFCLILFIGWLLVRFIGLLCYRLTYIGSQFTFISIASGLLGGVIHTVITYIFITMMLFVASFIPLQSVQDALDNSPIATAMIKETPVISNTIYRLWVTDIQQ